MAITRDEVRHLARLASLAVGEEELDRYAAELGRIVAYVDELRSADTAGVEPMAHAAATMAGRADEPGGMLTPEQALAGAPRAANGAFLVPKAVER